MLFTALALCASAVAQEQTVRTRADRPDTVKVLVSGDLELDYVNRSREVTAWIRSEGNPTGNGAAATSDAENTFEGFVAVRVDVELGVARFTLEFGTRRIDDNEIVNFLGDTAQDVLLRELNLILPELFLPGMTVTLGIADWSYDLRGRGQALVFAPRHSSTFTRNIDSLGNPTSEEIGDARLVEAGFPDELLPVGAVIVYRAGPWHVDLVIFPAVIEAGEPAQDESMYAADVMFKLDEAGSRIGAILAVNAFESNTAGGDLDEETAVFTFGVGVDLRDVLLKGLELYGEIYLQRGNAGQVVVGVAEESIQANGRAAQVGFEYNHVVGNPMPVWFGANLTYYSGDGDDAAEGNDEVDRFASYESVSDLIILENMYYGFDVDSNYRVIKLHAGARFSAVKENDLKVDVLVGFARQNEESNFGGSGEDALGNEVDLRAALDVSKQLVVHALFAILAGSDLVEESLRAGGSPDPDDSAWIWSMGMDVRF
ncbi:MAG TPA: hypothetical protein VF950_05875 [Planctomycetota bacterium]